MKKRIIGVFDSGVGGLTVLEEIKKAIPTEEYIYLKDTENFPYGEKSKEEIIKLTRNNIRKLIEKQAQLIVIACGTATSQALETVKKEFNIPIIGIIEPTVKSLTGLNLNKIGVMATTGTIRSGMWEKSIKKTFPEMEVVSQECPILASMAEEKNIYSKESLDAVHEYTEIFKKNQVDTIILGCTHYPIYDEIIKSEFEYNVNLINTGIAVAKEVKKCLKTLDITELY